MCSSDLLDGMILKPSMLISCANASNRADVETVARETVRCLLNTVPASVAWISFLSGGQSDEEASAHLNAMHNLGVDLPWPLTFSYGRALQQASMKAWDGKAENVTKAQAILLERASNNGKAAMGQYNPE